MKIIFKLVGLKGEILNLMVLLTNIDLENLTDEEAVELLKILVNCYKQLI